MRKRLTTRLGVAGIGALVVLAVTASPAYGLVRPAEPVPPAGLTGLEPTGADMPTVGGNLGNQHYSGLTQITKQNLKDLAPAWRTHVSAVAPATDDVGQQTTPIVVDGVIYVDTPSGGVIAVDGATGDPIWKWENDVYGLSGTRRGVSAGDGKIFTLAGGNRVVALDKATGEEIWAEQPVGPEGEDLGRVGKVATVYFDGIVYAHAADGDRGAVVALDASDGSYLWHFFGGPKRGQEFTGVDGVTFDASETWGPVLPDGTDCAEEGGATSWMHGAVDPELGMYYMTFGNARSCTPRRTDPSAPETTCSRARWSPWTPRPASTSGTTSRSTTTCGTWTMCTRRRWQTSRSTVRNGRSSSTAASRVTSSCWTARTASRCFP